MFRTVYILSFLLVLQSSVSVAYAQERADRLTVDAVSQTLKTMENVLNARQARENVAIFLHDYLQDDAVWQLNVQALDTRTEERFTIGKAEYIDSYLSGTDYIEDYHASLELVGLSVSEDGRSAISHERMTETGLVRASRDLTTRPRRFISTTTCKTALTLEEGAPVSHGGTCRTDIVWEEDV